MLVTSIAKKKHGFESHTISNYRSSSGKDAKISNVDCSLPNSWVVV